MTDNTSSIYYSQNPSNLGTHHDSSDNYHSSVVVNPNSNEVENADTRSLNTTTTTSTVHTVPIISINSINHGHHSSNNNTISIRNYRDLISTAVQFSEWENARISALNHTACRVAAENDQTRIAEILPHSQLFFLEARRCSISSFNLNGDLFTVRPVGQNRWIGPDLKFHPPPPPLKVPRFVISPQLAALWHGVLNPTVYMNEAGNAGVSANSTTTTTTASSTAANTTSHQDVPYQPSTSTTSPNYSFQFPFQQQEVLLPKKPHHQYSHSHPLPTTTNTTTTAATSSSSTSTPAPVPPPKGTIPSTNTTTNLHINPLKNLSYINLIIVQGLSGSQIRKIIVIESVREAACVCFHELANGFSVVFVGLMLKSEYEDIFEPRRSCQLCFDVDELKVLQARPKLVGGGGGDGLSGGKRLLGMIC